jgi:prepilin-type N-terminal cleavage/methylation domain-containing protein
MTFIRRYRGAEDGMTLLEVLVAMSILSVVLLVFTTVLASVQAGVNRQDSLSQTLDQARLSVQELDRELRSGNVLYDPALENAPAGTIGRIASCSGCLPGYTLRVYTQTNADTRATPGYSGYRCVLWKIANQQIMTRWWPPLAPANASGWRVVATGIVNYSLSPTVPAFSLDSDPLKGGRTLNVLYAVNSDLTHRASQTVKIQAALTGRNTSYGYPANICQVTPSG